LSLAAHWATEKTANVGLSRRQAAQSDVSILPTVQFQVGLQRNITGVDLQAEPDPPILMRSCPPTGGAHNTIAELPWPPLLDAQLASSTLKLSRQHGIHRVAG
jgi:hypothetical protein